MIHIQPASKLKRLLNLIIDVFIWQIFTFLVMIIFVFVELVLEIEIGFEESIIF